MKINSNDLSFLLVNNKNDNADAGIKSNNSDFYSMIMEESSISIKKDINNRESLNDSSSTNSVSENRARENDIENRNDSIVSKDRIGSENRDNEKNIQKNENITQINEKQKSSTSEQEKNKNDLKKNQKNSDLEDILTGISDSLTKKLHYLLHQVVKNETHDLEKNLRKLVEDVVLKHKKGDEKTGIILKGDEKHVNSKDFSSLLKNDFVDQIGKELVRIINNRKGDNKRIEFAEKDIKEAVNSVIESVKKNKTKEHPKADLRKADFDDFRNDKKADIITDNQSLKRKDTGTDTGFDSSSGKDKNSSRDQTHYTSLKVDINNRTFSDKFDSTLKAPEFKQSLQEIIDKAKITVRDSNNGSFSVRLFPKELGSVNVNLLMENGVVSGKFLVDNDEAKSQLLSNLSILKSELADAGITVGEFSVNVSNDKHFSKKNDEDENHDQLRTIKSESTAAVTSYDYTSATSVSDGHINMII